MEQEYEWTPLFYGTPCQVRFYNAIDGLYYGGIAFGDIIICGCCGGITCIEDVVSAAVEAGISCEDAVIELSWYDLSDAILY